jgi:hypothetical protein
MQKIRKSKKKKLTIGGIRKQRDQSVDGGSSRGLVFHVHLERFRWAGHPMRTAILLLRLLHAMIFLLRGLKLQLANGFAKAFHEAAMIITVIVFLFIELALLPCHLLLLSERTLTWTGNLACGRQARLGETLLGW